MGEVQFSAVSVECSEAIDWEIMRVLYDWVKDRLDECGRTGPYLTAMLPKRSFRDHCLAEYGPAPPPIFSTE